jgi:tRNA(fMet)-specific endonuclease VapC
VRTYLLDSNVVSEPMKPRPDPVVLRRLAEHEGDCAISAITWHELWFGIDRLPSGRRRNALTAYVRLVPSQFPILDYDGAAAEWHAALRARDAAAGTARPFADGQIAAVAATNDLTLVTRNTADFAGIDGLALENWHRSG